MVVTKSTNMAKIDVWRQSFLGTFLKSVVYGGMDGIITTFAVVCAAVGADFTLDAVITVGVSSLVADAISMGIGDFISDTAEQDFACKEQKHRLLQCAENPQQASQELATHYKERGMSESDAQAVAAILSKYGPILADELLAQKDGLQPPDHADIPWRKGCATFFSFLFFGSVPLLIFLLGDKLEILFHNSPLSISTVASALTMFTLGALSGMLTHQGLVRSGLFMTMHGLFAAFAAYVIGKGMEAVSCQDIFDSSPKQEL